MNIHIGQSIQTVTELHLIANAAKRFVGPATSRIAINAKQDTLMGSYLLTYPDIRVDWKDAMNILMTTSVKLNGEIPKHKLLSGKYLYSQIIPKEINVIKKDAEGKVIIRIHNGMITNGVFGKSEISNIIQRTWFQYGSKETLNFIDDLQRLILQWLLRYGFTLSIGNIVVPEKIHKAIRDIIETKRKEVLNSITEYQNDPYIMTSEAFETTLEAGLRAIQGDIDSTAMSGLSKDNGLYIAISSGSSGVTLNAGQIIGCIGQVIVEDKRIRKKYNNRTLPMFFQFDESAFARGFCHSSFIKGLEPAEFFFQVMAGREGVINTAIKTADTGYIQRKLIKILEDIKVDYDGTVRNANDKMIQCIYGDNGINTEKQIEQKIALISANNKTVRDNYTHSAEEIIELKKKHHIDKRYTAELSDDLYRKLIAMRDHARRIQKHINTSSVSFKDIYMMPIDIHQLIMNITNREDRDTTSLVDPYYVLTQIKSMYTNPYSKIMKYINERAVIKKMDEYRSKFLLKFYLYDALVPKKCLNVYKLSTEEFDEIVLYFKHTFLLARVEGGEMIGIIAAQSIGEPVTQSNLKSFHKAGTRKTGALGLPRVKELASMTRNIKTPVMNIILEQQYKNDKVVTSKIASHLKYTTLADIIENVDIAYDPDPLNKNSIMTKDGVDSIFQVTGSKSGCQSEIQGLPWTIRLVLSKEKMIERNVTMLEIKTSFCHNWSIRHEESKGSKKEYKKVIDKINQCAIVTNYDNSPIPTVHIRFDANNYNFNTLIQFQEMIVSKYKIKGIANITESNNIQEEKYVDFDEDGNVVKKEQWIIITEGINLHDISQINGINLSESSCNDIIAIYEMYGVEAARTTFIREFTLAIESSGGSSNYQHVAILADAVTHMGGLIAVNRHGANKLDTDPFSRASFEKTVEQMLAAAVFGESDHIRSVSARIMVGSLINGGTGAFDLLLDHIKVKKTLKSIEEEVPVQAKITKKSTAISDLIRKKKSAAKAK